MKDLKKLGKSLTRAEQKSIKGGRRVCSAGCGVSPCCSDGYCLDKLNRDPNNPGQCLGPIILD